MRRQWAKPREPSPWRVVESSQRQQETSVGSQSKRDVRRRIGCAFAPRSVVVAASLAFCTSAFATITTALLPSQVATAAAATTSAIPATVRAELLTDAKREAGRPPYSYRHPSAIQVVLTTETKAWALENQSRNVTLACGQCGTGSVYFIAMRGSSDCKTAPGELRTCSTHAPVFMFWVSPSTMKVSRTARGSVYPNLVTVGTPVSLG